MLLLQARVYSLSGESACFWCTFLVDPLDLLRRNSSPQLAPALQRVPPVCAVTALKTKRKEIENRAAEA